MAQIALIIVSQIISTVELIDFKAFTIVTTLLFGYKHEKRSQRWKIQLFELGR